jgi:4'-phosphopantetheinyl transferase
VAPVRREFVVARGLLRLLLAAYVNTHPRDVAIRYNPYGKPHLADEHEKQGIFFNVAHSRGAALFVVTRGRQVGVDLERIRDDVEYESIATTFFSPYEMMMLHELPIAEQRTAFFDCWTRKEAYVKATGEGLSVPLDRIRVSFIPGEQPQLIEVPGKSDECRQWKLQALRPFANYTGAIVAQMPLKQLQCCDPQRAWQRRANPVRIALLHLVLESRDIKSAGVLHFVSELRLH